MRSKSTAYRIARASPSRFRSSGTVDRKHGSQNTARGSGTGSPPVVPPTAVSSMAESVVGRKTEKPPVASPFRAFPTASSSEPPPRTTSASFSVGSASCSARATVCASQFGRSIRETERPARDSDASSLSPHRAPAIRAVSRTARAPCPTAERSRSPASRSSVSPIRTSQGVGALTDSRFIGGLLSRFRLHRLYRNLPGLSNGFGAFLPFYACTRKPFTNFDKCDTIEKKNRRGETIWFRGYSAPGPSASRGLK